MFTLESPVGCSLVYVLYLVSRHFLGFVFCEREFVFAASASALPARHPLLFLKVVVADASSVLGAAAASSALGKGEGHTLAPDTAIIEGFDLNVQVSVAIMIVTAVLPKS